MTDREAIGRIIDHMAVHHIGEYPHIKLEDALKCAISALEERIDREKNEPLTLDDLKMMIGEPVFIVTSGLKEWCIVHSYHRPEVIGRAFIMTRRTAEKRQYAFDGYGKTWMAYPVAHGEWIELHDENGNEMGVCSRCRHMRIIDNYCPNCGAKMDLED